jgi:murein DD-endopeptidase MepM/ murein hydrolase activator NlpD
MLEWLSVSGASAEVRNVISTMRRPEKIRTMAMQHRLPVSVILVLAPALLFMGGDTAAAKESPEEEIRRLASQVAEITVKQAGILDQLELAKARVRLSEKILNQARNRRAEVRGAIEESQEEMERLLLQENATLGYLALRIRQRYSLGILQDFRVLFAANTTQDVKEAGLYLATLAERDSHQIQEYRELQERQKELRMEMELAQGQLVQLERQAEEEYSILLAEKATLTEILSRTSEEKEGAQQALDETLEAARTLNRYMEDLAFQTRIEMLSKNMADRHGSLDYPVKGRIVQGFGDYIHPKFRTRIPHPGLDISAADGTPARAVFDGEVAYSGWLSGYGYTVILSHPGGFFTVYGHLKETRIGSGDVIKEGGTLGLTGGTGSPGSPLYFELRQGSRAVDPKSWFSKERK